jgi:hypothetical protein
LQYKGQAVKIKLKKRKYKNIKMITILIQTINKIVVENNLTYDKAIAFMCTCQGVPGINISNDSRPMAR